MPALKKILILGGTKEASEIASILFENGHDVTVSLAGRTREPVPLKAKTRIGGFGGADGLASYIQQNHITLLVDLTHPFARTISNNARLAAQATGVKFIAWHRPQWQQIQGDNWLIVQTINDAVSSIPAHARVLLALGSQHIAPFAARSDVHFLVRMVDPPLTPLTLPIHRLIAGKPGSVEQERTLLTEHNITYIVCRNSGGAAAYTKIAAARILQLPVIVISQTPSTSHMDTFDSFLEKIFAHLQ